MKNEQMLSQFLKSFLDKFIKFSTPGVNLLHIRAISSVLAKLGYTLEKNLPPMKRPVRDPNGLLAVTKPTSASATSSSLLPQPSAGQDTLINAYQAALLARIKSVAPSAASTSQQVTSVSTVLSSEHLLQSSKTGTSSQHRVKLESDMDAQLSDFGADFGDKAAHETTASQPASQPESRIPTVTTEATKLKKLVPQTLQPNVKKDKQAHKSQSIKRMRISSTEGEAQTSLASGSAQPGTTKPRILNDPT